MKIWFFSKRKNPGISSVSIIIIKYNHRACHTWVLISLLCTSLYCFSLILRKHLRFRKVLKKTHLLTWYRYRSTLLHNTSFNWHTHNNWTSRVKDVLRKDSKLAWKYCNVFEFLTFLLLQFLEKEIRFLIDCVTQCETSTWLKGWSFTWRSLLSRRSLCRQATPHRVERSVYSILFI